MTREEALEVVAEAAMDIGPPFDDNRLARAGKVLHDEIERLETIIGNVKVLLAEGEWEREVVRANRDGLRCTPADVAHLVGIVKSARAELAMEATNE